MACNKPAFRSFGFELQGPRSAFTSWRARIRYTQPLALPAHNQKLVLRHVTFVLQQLFQISLERVVSDPRPEHTKAVTWLRREHLAQPNRLSLCRDGRDYFSPIDFL